MSSVRAESILFIGPMGVGKTSVAQAVSAVLGLTYIDADELRWDYFARQPDFDSQVVEELFNAAKGMEAFAYMKPFEARYAVDLLSTHPCGVFDFGAGYSVYQSPELFETIKKAFAPYKHVVYLRYSGDPVESLEALRERHPDVPEALYDALNREFVESPCNDLLATHIIDTKNKTIQEVVDLVLAEINAT